MTNKMHIVPQKIKLNQQVIDILKEQLELAQAGETLEIVLIREREDGAFSIQSSGYKDLSKTLGQIEMLKFDLVNQSLRK